MIRDELVPEVADDLRLPLARLLLIFEPLRENIHESYVGAPVPAQ